MADKNPDGSTTYAPDAHDRALMRQAQQELAQFRVPVMVHARNPHERLYIAAFDGTGNDRNNPKMGEKTNVALIYEQIELLNARETNRLMGVMSRAPAPRRAGTNG